MTGTRELVIGSGQLSNDQSTAFNIGNTMANIDNWVASVSNRINAVASRVCLQSRQKLYKLFLQKKSFLRYRDSALLGRWRFFLLHTKMIYWLVQII